jgi:hypothetical protein
LEFYQNKEASKQGVLIGSGRAKRNTAEN